MRKVSVAALFAFVLGLFALAGCESGGQDGMGDFEQPPAGQGAPQQDEGFGAPQQDDGFGAPAQDEDGGGM
ncbi:hypothetical protein CAI21_09105 [Alkalilimnicola ehrlichii]|uniref:Lipoprotein n=1 Tax=Alkalilimnicola ehrlichii TaxID=351052 RepID=A0A3E0WU89_9GAMM|nr:hypothetical protein [Alkalilimnicola ehrlichii]RFA29963.1 hypothetical protein CAI21_09105 [Alkalilimnicola ehrlichii]RFA36554.1 hypothetical protein CAL65_11380 [Alkalilimnicola ehrlichii]